MFGFTNGTTNGTMIEVTALEIIVYATNDNLFPPSLSTITTAAVAVGQIIQHIAHSMIICELTFGNTLIINANNTKLPACNKANQTCQRQTRIFLGSILQKDKNSIKNNKTG